MQFLPFFACILSIIIIWCDFLTWRDVNSLICGKHASSLTEVEEPITHCLTYQANGDLRPCPLIKGQNERVY